MCLRNFLLPCSFLVCVWVWVCVDICVLYVVLSSNILNRAHITHMHSIYIIGIMTKCKKKENTVLLPITKWIECYWFQNKTSSYDKIRTIEPLKRVLFHIVCFWYFFSFALSLLCWKWRITSKAFSDICTGLMETDFFCVCAMPLISIGFRCVWIWTFLLMQAKHESFFFWPIFFYNVIMFVTYVLWCSTKSKET